MKKLLQRNIATTFAVVLGSICLTSCSTSKTNYKREYAKVWKELIKSKAWQESLYANNTNELYTSNENEVTLVEESKVIVGFEDKYQALVSKAYFKIITEAEKADVQISAEYEQLQADKSSVKVNKKRNQEVTKKYEAHKAMLSGLKSWNIFSEDRSGDLDYFKAENEVEIQKMIHSGEQDYQMINYLIYKLADLYHVEEN